MVDRPSTWNRGERGEFGEGSNRRGMGERIGPNGYPEWEREHNVSHSARSCIFYDMASNLTSRARHNSRPCAELVCVARASPPSYVRGDSGPLALLVCAACVACIDAGEHAREA